MSSIQEDLLQQYHEKLEEEQKADFENVKLKIINLNLKFAKELTKYFERYQTLYKE